MKKKTTHKFHKKKLSFDVPRISFYIAILTCVVLAAAYVVKPFKNEAFCANSISCVNELSGNFDEEAKIGEFMGKKVVPPSPIAKAPDANVVLGESTGGEKHIYVDLTNQKLYAKEGDETVHEFPVSTGLWGRTPTGDFKIWIKLKYTRMSGGNPSLGTYYNLPNVPYTMFYSNSEVPKTMGYSIHGAYWHNNFGHPMSHGCINMRPEDAETIFYWADPPVGDASTLYVSESDKSTPVTVYGVAPAS